MPAPTPRPVLTDNSQVGDCCRSSVSSALLITAQPGSTRSTTPSPMKPNSRSLNLSPLRNLGTINVGARNLICTLAFSPGESCPTLSRRSRQSKFSCSYTKMHECCVGGVGDRRPPWAAAYRWMVATMSAFVCSILLNHLRIITFGVLSRSSDPVGTTTVSIPPSTMTCISGVIAFVGEKGDSLN
jgi:hypothetical protein